ncbi:MAG: peptidylprolyl isomerase [Paludibacteraceae bacterium]|nr:peptidylprolyl isomerase [Paludibacteraceae bacterium]
MKKTFLSIVLMGASLLGFAQEDKVLMTINGEPIMASEFLYIYEKNNQETSLEKKSMEEYLDLFINFKLKVTEAIAQGVDTTQEFKDELKGYRAQATPKYLQDNAAIDSLVLLSYNRMANIRKASHIAVQCPMDADSATLAAATAKINELRQRVTVGLPKEVKKGRKKITVQEVEDFAEVAMTYSDDPAAKQNKGELGWIQPFRYVYPLEDAVYNTPIGEITEVFRSPFGLHIAKVEGERAFEEAHAAHIMKMTPSGDLQRLAAATFKMDSLYQLAIQDTVDFAALAQANSEDRGSAMRGGDLGWFGRGAMVQPFEDITFGLQEGEISKPFQTRFGIHISKLYGKRGIQPLDSMRSQLLRQVQRDQRMQIANESFIAKTRAEYNLPAEMSDADVKAYADARLEEKYPELRNLVREYHDGILLFDVSLREVWDKANKDHEGLTAFFKANKKQYTWDEPRYKGWLIYAKTDLAAKAAKQIVKGASDKAKVDSILNERVNLDSVTYVKVEYGLWTAGKNAAVDVYGFKNKTATYSASEEYPVVVTVGKVLKRPEEYNDDRGKIVTDYQDYLEKLWIASLREKYPVVINEKVWEALKAL